MAPKSSKQTRGTMTKMKVESESEATDMCQRFSEEPGEVENSRSQTIPRMFSNAEVKANISKRSEMAQIRRRKAWKNKSKLWRKLGFVRQDLVSTELFRFQNSRLHPPVKVDQYHSITGWDQASELILVDEKHVLPLKKDAIGTLLKLDSETRIVSTKKNKIKLMDWVGSIPQGARRIEDAFNSTGIEVGCLREDLRSYIQGRYGALGWGTSTVSGAPKTLSLREANALMEEMVSESKIFDWVSIRTEQIRCGFATGRRHLLSPLYLEFLSRYIREALKFSPRQHPHPEKGKIRASKRRRNRVVQDEDEFATAQSGEECSIPEGSNISSADVARPRRKLVKTAGVYNWSKVNKAGDEQPPWPKGAAVDREHVPITTPSAILNQVAVEDLQYSTTVGVTAQQLLQIPEVKVKAVEVSAPSSGSCDLRAIQKSIRVLKQDVAHLKQALAPSDALTCWQAACQRVRKFFGLPA